MRLITEPYLAVGLPLVGGTVGSVLFVGAGGLVAQDNANLFWDDTLNNLGLGITAPLAQFHAVHGTSGYSAFTDIFAATTTPGFLVSDSITDSSFAGATTNFRAGLFQVSADPTVNASRTITGLQGSSVIPSSNAVALSSYTVNGGTFNTRYTGTGSLLALQGNTMTATQGGTGVVTSVNGLNVTSQRNSSGTGNVTTLRGLLVNLTNSATSGTIATAVGLDIASLTNAAGATITDTYGIQIGDLTTGTQTNQAYSIIVNDYNTRMLIKGTRSDFYFTADSTGGVITLQTDNVPSHGTAQNQTLAILQAGVDKTGTPTYFGNPIMRGYLINASATPTDKALGEVGWEGTYDNSSVLGTTTHFYVWDAINSRTMLSHSYVAGSGTTVVDTGFNALGSADLSVLETTAVALTKNNATTATYTGIVVKPTFNTGGSNANTTVDVIRGDTVNTAVTGLTVNLLRLFYGNTQKFQIDSTGNVKLGAGVLAWSPTAPTISSGFGASPSIAANNGTVAFTVNVGTGGVATGGVIGMPAATTGWICHCQNQTAVAANRGDQRTIQTASSTTSVTVQNQTISTGAALAWTASDILVLTCVGY